MNVLNHYSEMYSKRDLKISVPRKVIRFEDECFKDNGRVRKISLSEDLVHLGNKAFENCIALEEVKFRGHPKLTYISKWCFSGCRSLREVQIPDSVGVIKKYAFKDCISINMLEIPKGVIVENGAFDGWNPTQKILVHEEVKWGIACKAEIINLEAKDFDELSLVYETDEGLRYYEVLAKCGHVGNHRYMPIHFAVKAHTAKEAAKITRKLPRVKHDHKDAILNVRQISKREYIDLSEKNYDDPYLKIRSKYQQKNIEDLIDSRALPETRLQSNN